MSYCEMCKSHHRRFEQAVSAERYPLTKFAYPPAPKQPCDEWQLVSAIVLPDLPIDCGPGEYLMVVFYWQRPLHDPAPARKAPR